ncbi:hypothetical protein Fmac_026302 [Flemingia macrophylla]|uniref:USP domain-containing protein n=1 Tax=Flemingia macrophylla TaxID=520843 RepID=A0ABD1LEQ5_9FABA
MGHKKRNPAPRSKQSPAASPAAQSVGAAANGAASPEADAGGCNASGQSNPSKIELAPPQSEGSDSSTIKAECERALTTHRRGNHTKAMKLLKEICGREEGSPHAAFAHRVHSLVCFKTATVLTDPASRQRYLKNAVESARRAVQLTPNSVEYAHFLATVLLEAASDGKDYEEVVHECERGLAIENPSDPGKETLHDESEQKSSTPEERIAHVQNELRQLIQKSNIASLSSWMKNLSNGEERFRLIPIRRTPEDPMEVRLVPTRRPNDIKKVTKTPEERRKEIEVRVAAARLLQQKSESPNSPNDGERDDRALDSSLGSGQRIGAGGDRRRHGNLRKNGFTAERMKWVRGYWSSVSLDVRKDFLRVKISDLKSHYGSSKDTLPNEILAEALSYAEADKTWKFWLCCNCEKKDSNPDSHRHHVVQEHMGSLSPQMQRLLPQHVDNEWVEMILNCSWRPLDVIAAVRMLDNKAKFRSSSFPEDLYMDHHTPDYNDCFKDAGSSYIEKDSTGDSLRNYSAECNNHCKIIENDVTGGVEDQLSMANPIIDCWPVSDDYERATLLEKIHCKFETLIRHKCLAASHLNKVIQFTMGEIQGLAAGSQLLNHGVDQTPMCICFLGASQLKTIFQFLQEICHACGVERPAEKSGSPANNLPSIIQGPEIKDKIVLDEDASCLLLDECLLQTQVTPGTAQGAVLDDVTTSGSPEGISCDNDALLSWIFSGSPIGDQLTSWLRTREDKINKGKEIVQMLEKEFYHLQGLCEKKGERISYEEALQTVEDLCLEEGKKRETVGEFVQRSYESVLRKRREELIESENEMMYVSNRFELDAITNVLQEAEARNVNQFGYEETYAGVTSQLCDLESGEEDEWRMKDYLHQMDGCIENAIQKLKEHLSIEALLEDLAEKDAREKSDAASEAFLAELALDSKKAVKGGSENTRHVEKTKDKKKNKDHRKARDLKSTGGHVQFSLRPTTPDSNLVPPESDFPDHEDVSMNDDDLEQLEEEFRRKIELEEEEKKLEETLEFQRRIENEAKQKHLAEQQKKSSGLYSEEVADKLQDCQTKVDDDPPDAHEHVRVPLQEQLVKENGSPIDLDGALTPTANGSTVNYLHQSKVKQLWENNASDAEEERFQADLKMAVRQSLDTYQARGNLPSVSSFRKSQRASSQVDSVDCPRVDDSTDNVNGATLLGTGLKNESLWHLRRFRVEFLGRSRSEHDHVGNPCVVCALYEIFTALDIASKDSRREAVAPTSLRIALSNLYPHSNFFQEAQMNDASEVLEVIFDCLHRSFTRGSSVSDAESAESNCMGSWDCANGSCIAHLLFGMNIFEQMNCYHCGRESRHMKYTSFFHNINASALRTMKVMFAEASFDKLLNLVEMNHQLACDLEAGGCGKLNHIHHFLSTPPHVFMTGSPVVAFGILLTILYAFWVFSLKYLLFTVLGWQNTCESADDITATLAALSTKMDISVLYRGLDPKCIHNLVSVVCYYGQHYHCFAYSHDHEQWIMYDDKTVKVIGGWADVLTMCERGHLQPQVLFFEAVN